MVNKKKAAGASSATHQQNTASNDTNTNTNNNDSTAQKIIEHLELMNERNQKEMRNLMESFEDRFMHKFNEINERINQQEKINTEKLDDGLNRMIEMKKEEQEGFNMMNGGLEDGQAAHSLPHEFLEHLKGILHDFVVHEINGPITENIIMTKRMLNMMEGGDDDRYNSNNNNTMKQGPPGDNDSIGMPPSPPHGGGGPPGPNNGGNPNNRPPFSDHDDYGVVNTAPPRGRNDEPPQFRQQQQHPPPQQIIHPDNHRRMRSNSVDSQRSYYSDRGDNRGGRDGFNNRNFNNNMNNNSFNHQGPPQNLYQGERGDSDINDRLSMSDGGVGGRGGPPERLESLGSNNNNNNIGGGGGPGPGARFMMNERHGGYPNAQNPRELPSYVLTQRFTIGDLLDGKKRKGLQIPRVSNGRTNICLKYHCLQSGCKHGDNCDYVDSHRRLNSDEQARLERFVKDCLTDDGFNSMDGSGHGGGGGGGGAHYNRGGGGGRGGHHPFNRGRGGGPPHRDNSFGGQGGGAGAGGPRDDDSYNNNNNNHNNGNFHHHPNNRNKGNSWANNNNNAGGDANENFNNGNRRTPLKWSPPEDGIKRRRMNYD